MDRHADANRAFDAVCNAIGTQRDRLLAVVRRNGGTKVDPEEVLHIAIQRALERANQVREPARAEAWVGRVVRNVLIDELRKQREPVLDTDTHEVAVPADDQPFDCWCVLVQAEQLKPEYAEILRHVIVEGRAVTDVAPTLGLTPNNAMVRLHRARIALKERMHSHCGTTTAKSCSDCGCRERECCPPP